MGILEEFYDGLRYNRRVHIKMPHSAVHYARSAIEWNTGYNITLEETTTLMYEEGYFPAKCYGIPLWYRRKYQLDSKKERETFPSWYKRKHPVEYVPAFAKHAASRRVD